MDWLDGNIKKIFLWQAKYMEGKPRLVICNFHSIHPDEQLFSNSMKLRLDHVYTVITECIPRGEEERP